MKKYTVGNLISDIRGIFILTCKILAIVIAFTSIGFDIERWWVSGHWYRTTIQEYLKIDYSAPILNLTGKDQVFGLLISLDAYLLAALPLLIAGYLVRDRR